MCVVCVSGGGGVGGAALIHEILEIFTHVESPTSLELEFILNPSKSVYKFIRYLVQVSLDVCPITRLPE